MVNLSKWQYLKIGEVIDYLRKVPNREECGIFEKHFKSHPVTDEQLKEIEYHYNLYINTWVIPLLEQVRYNERRRN